MKEGRASGGIIKIITTREYNGWTLDAPRVLPSLAHVRGTFHKIFKSASGRGSLSLCKYRGFVAAAIRPDQKNEILRLENLYLPSFFFLTTTHILLAHLYRVYITLRINLNGIPLV